MSKPWSLIAVLVVTTGPFSTPAWAEQQETDNLGEQSTQTSSEETTPEPVGFADPAVRQGYFEKKHEALDVIAKLLEGMSQAEAEYHLGLDLMREIVARSNGDIQAANYMASAIAGVHQYSENEGLRHHAIELMALSNSSKTTHWLSYKVREEPYRRTVVRTLGYSPLPQAGDLLLHLLENDENDEPEIYLRALGARGEARAIEKIIPHLESSRPEVVRAAISSLGRIPSIEAAEALIPHAMDDETEKGMAAMLAIDNLAGLLGGSSDPAVGGAIFGKMLTDLTSPRAHALAIKGMYRAGGVAEAELLAARIPQLDDPRLKPLIMETAVNIGRRVDHSEKPEMFVKLYEQCLDFVSDTHPARQILLGRLRALGVGEDIRVENGVIPKWWVHGGIACEGPQDWDTPHFPETDGVDVEKRTPFGRYRTEWITLESELPDGTIDLGVVNPRDRSIAYAYAEVDIPGTGNALLKTGSDDGLVVWVNGERVFSHFEPRPHQAEQDTTPVKLHKGLNKLLLKICDETEDWKFSVRLLDEKGQPFSFVVKN